MVHPLHKAGCLDDSSGSTPDRRYRFQDFNSDAQVAGSPARIDSVELQRTPRFALDLTDSLRCLGIQTVSVVEGLA